MAKSKDNVIDVLNSVSLDDVLEVQLKIDLYVRFLLGSHSKEGGRGAKNPARRPQKGRPITKGLEGETFRRERCAWEGRQSSGARR